MGKNWVRGLEVGMSDGLFAKPGHGEVAWVDWAVVGL